MEYVYTKKNGQEELYLDISDIQLEYDITEYEHLLYFSLSSYTKLKQRKDTNQQVEWNNVLGIVNNLFRALCESDKIAIAKTLITLHGVLLNEMEDIITTMDRHKINLLMRELSEILLELETEINLCDKIKQFIYDTNVPLGNFKNVGRRPQDRPELTFNKDEVAELTTIAVVCKMLMPIFSVFMYNVKSFIDTQVKERHCSAVLTKLIQHRFCAVFNKLQNYIMHNVGNNFNETTGTIFNIKTEVSLSQQLIDIMLVRNLVNVNPYTKNGNLMTYILVTTKKSINTQDFNTRRNQFQIRRDSFDEDDETNKSQFEQDTICSSRKKLDIYGLVKHSSKRAIRSTLEYYQLNTDVYDKNVQYYNDKVFQPNEINIFLACMFFSDSVGGAQSIRLLDYEQFMRTITTLQLLCGTLEHYSIAHLLTANPTDNLIIKSTESNMRLKLNYQSSASYQACRTRYENSQYGIGVKTWDDSMEHLLNALLEKTYTFNSAPEIWKVSTNSTQNYNGRKIEIPDSLVEELCNFIYNHCKI